MTRVFFSLMILVFFCKQHTKAQVQVKVRAGFETSIVNPSNYIFEQNPKINVVQIHGEKGKYQNVAIYYVGKAKNVITADEYYDMFFVGDQHLFRKKYPKFEFPKVPEPQMTYLPDMKLDPAYRRNFFVITTYIKRDSIRQHYSFYTAEGTSEATLKYTGNRPKWKGDVSKLNAKLSDSFSKWKTIKSVDTIMILQGIVTRKGELKPLEIIEGATFPYADKLAELIHSETLDWWPGTYASDNADLRVRIAVTRKQDQTLAVSIL